ncbi:MAG: hypothetical protein Q7U57_12290 [Methylovulum sp.]|nr:hypothetical protein [Methylovulum sp.]
MADLSSIFDGVIDNDIPVKPPIAVLKELGAEFEKLTKGLLSTEVEQRYYSSRESMQASFIINAPSLNNYSYEVFEINYDLNFYPLTISCRQFDTESKEAANQEELETILKDIFLSPGVKKVVNGLLAQIKYA